MACAMLAANGCSAAPASTPGAILAPIELGDLQRASETQAKSRLASSTPAQMAAPMPGGGAALAPLEDDLLNALAVTTSRFDLRPGETLRAALTRWTQDAGWQLVWDSSRDYRIEAGMTFPRGTTLNDAIKETIHSVWMANPTLKADLYRNNVLVITEVKA